MHVSLHMRQAYATYNISATCDKLSSIPHIWSGVGSTSAEVRLRQSLANVQQKDTSAEVGETGSLAIEERRGTLGW